MHVIFGWVSLTDLRTLLPFRDRVICVCVCVLLPIPFMLINRWWWWNKVRKLVHCVKEIFIPLIINSVLCFEKHIFLFFLFTRLLFINNLSILHRSSISSVLSTWSFQSYLLLTPSARANFSCFSKTVICYSVLYIAYYCSS